MSLSLVIQLWNRFWFVKESPAPLCVLRIAYGLVILTCLINWAPDVLLLFGNNGVVTAEAIQSFNGGPRFSLLFLLPDNDEYIVALFYLMMTAACCVTVGLFTRVSLIVLFVLLVSFQNRNSAMLISADYLLSTMAFILALSPAGQMFSLDYWRKKRAGKAIEHWDVKADIWPLRLLQLQFTAVYYDAFVGKALSRYWQDGTAVYYVSRIDILRHMPVPFVFDHLWTCQLLTWSTVVIELALCTLVWVKPLRYYVLAAGLLMHLCLEWCLTIPIFQYAMITLYLSFVEPTHIKCFIDSIASGAQRLHNRLLPAGGH